MFLWSNFQAALPLQVFSKRRENLKSQNLNPPEFDCITFFKYINKTSGDFKKIKRRNRNWKRKQRKDNIKKREERTKRSKTKQISKKDNPK